MLCRLLVQFEGANAPLGVNPEPKKRQYWPGDEPDDHQDSGNKATKTVAQPNSKPKVGHQVTYTEG
jgi:hypothetical protein